MERENEELYSIWLTNHNRCSLILKVQGQLSTFFGKLSSRSKIHDFATNLFNIETDHVKLSCVHKVSVNLIDHTYTQKLVQNKAQLNGTNPFT